MGPWLANLLNQPAQAILLIALMLGGVLILIYAVRTGVPPMPTGPTVRRAMFDFLPGRVDGVVYDLGSGWGGMAIALAERYPDNRVVGIELSPLPWLWSRLRLAIRPRPNLTFQRANFLKQPLDDAGAITCYLMIGAMTPLAAKLKKELKPGSVIVSHAFALRGWEPEKVAIVRAAGSAWVYRYVAGRSVACSNKNDEGGSP